MYVCMYHNLIVAIKQSPSEVTPKEGEAPLSHLLFICIRVCVEYVTWMLFDGTISKLSVTVSHFLVFLSRSFSFHSHQRRHFTRISLARSLSLSFNSHSVLPFWREFCIY